MRISTVSAQAAASLPDARPVRRSFGPVTFNPTTAPSPAIPGRADVGPHLPSAIADRLALLLAQDPGLAEAVSAQLPAARRDSARDIEAYAAAGSGRCLDLAG
jgi:hypothetical protein